MNEQKNNDWRKKVVSPEQALKGIRPGMSIFVGTGLAEPRTLMKQLMTCGSTNLQDLELIQLVSLGDAISIKEIHSHKFRLKTFFSGWVASEAITGGQVDLIPSRFSRIPRFIRSRQIPIDVAFVQVTPPDDAGYCSLGVAVDVAHQAIRQASLVIGEIHPAVPLTLGDTFVPVSAFDFFVEATEPPLYFPRWPVDAVFERVAANVAAEIGDGCCLAFSLGPLYESLARHLMNKHDLGLHTPFFSDASMDLVKSGAVSNRNKEIWLGKSVTSYAFGTPELMKWLDRNPLVEFQGIDKVFDAIQIGRNKRFVMVLPARKVDLSGRVAMHFGKGNVTAGPGEAMDFFNGAEISAGGLNIFALPSRNRQGAPNILLSVEEFPNQFGLREAIDMVVTEYGVAYLSGRTVRERAQALIEIAHPDDRAMLVEQARDARILYRDQIFLAESAGMYPAEVATRHTFRNGLDVRFRAIRPSDEEGMRRLFYRFSDESVYYRYFSAVKTMPHAKMQEYVNVDYRKVMSIVALVGEAGHGTIIGEARFIKNNQQPPFADVAFIVDEAYQGVGIASFMYQMLIRLAKDRGIKGFTADVLASNTSMMKVFEKGGTPFKAKLEYGTYSLNIPFEEA